MDILIYEVVGITMFFVLSMIIAKAVYDILAKIIFPPRIAKILNQCRKFPESRIFK